MSLLASALMLMILREGRADNAPTAEFYLDTRHITSYRMKPVATFSDPADRIVLERNAVLKVLIHGWTEEANRTHYMHLSRAFLKNATCNVIRVDYSSISHQNYIMAVSGVETVGNFIADYLMALIAFHAIPMQHVHVIGHSLGGQVSGYVGRRIFKKMGTKLQHITALDPASPLFENNPDARKLTRKDAVIVDIVHTDGGFLGYSGKFGSVDFMPNGGVRNQPECYSKDSLFCSHQKSLVYYIASVLMDILALRCDSWKDFRSGVCDENEMILFGARMPDAAKGSFYFELDIDDDLIPDVLLGQEH